MRAPKPIPKTAKPQTYIYYIRDAQGNIMATYSRDYPVKSGNTYTEELRLNEHVLYGSSRLGIKTHNKLLTTATFSCTSPNCFGPKGDFMFPFADYSAVVPPNLTPNTFTRQLDNKHYEMTNHLGNVLATVTDRKLPQDNNSDQIIDLFDPVFSSAHSYYPFGMVQPNAQNLVSAEGYQFGFNGMELDDEVKGFGNHVDFGARIYDPRIVRWPSVDKLANKHPFFSPYIFAANSPLKIIDIDGNELQVITPDATDKALFETIINVAFAGQVEIEVGENGLVSMNIITTALTKEDQALFDALNETITDPQIFSVYLVPDVQREEVGLGEFRAADEKYNAIDLDDLEIYDGTPLSKEGNVIHEVYETYWDQKYHSDKEDNINTWWLSHNPATEVQKKVENLGYFSALPDEGYDKTGTGSLYLQFSMMEGEEVKHYTLEIVMKDKNPTDRILRTCSKTN